MSGDPKTPHVAFIPGVGMGHLLPHARLAATLANRGCHVSFVSILPTVSAAESTCLDNLFAAYPNIKNVPFQLPLNDTVEGDPFILRDDAIRRAAHLLPSVLATCHAPLSAVMVDIFFVSTFIPVITEMGLPSYIPFISIAAMISLAAYFHEHLKSIDTEDCARNGVGDIVVPGLRRFPAHWLPAPLHDLKHPFTVQFLENGQGLKGAKGMTLNTFPGLEDDDVAALAGGHVVPGFPPIFTVGPLQPLVFELSETPKWLDDQPDNSVVFVSFGNRSALSKEQIRELGYGLERSGCRFLWVVKSKIVDRDDEGVTLEELLGHEYLNRVKDRGLVVKEWVAQVPILKHRAVGGFFSHAGSNSVVEAAMCGVAMLAWPRGGDQRVCAELVVRSGMGIWPEGWSWGQDGELVKGEEIAVKMKEMMGDEKIRARAAALKEEAEKAVDVGGSSYQMIEDLISTF